jgi:hypothetical protein
VYVVGGDTGVVLLFTPFCKNGANISNETLCENDPPQIVGAEVVMYLLDIDLLQ